MDAGQLFQGAFTLIKMCSPFLLVFLALVYGQEAIGLVRTAVLGRGRKGWY